MSGTKLKCLIVCKLIFGICYAVSWHNSSTIYQNHDPYLNPAFFPDTLCLASYWSPVYSGFGIQEGMIYVGTNKFDISIKNQYHKLMSNHQLNIGVRILNEQYVTAGLQFHYSLSALHGVQTLHKGSCSGALNIRPQSAWQISLYSMHILSFPRDSTERLLEPELGAQFSISPFSFLDLSIHFSKTMNLSWRIILGVRWTIIDELVLRLYYEPEPQNISISIDIGLARWKARSMFSFHSYLGFSQDYMLAYEY